MIVNQKILAIIPARGGSKGMPGKNLRMLQNKTLLARTIGFAQASVYIDHVIVSSEDTEILNEAKQFGDDIPFKRPAELAKDDTPGIDPILHALTVLDLYDYTMVLQVTSPFRTTEDIDACIRFCIKKNALSCVSIVKTKTHPYWMMFKNEDDMLQPFYQEKIPVRRQDLPDIYALNGAIYFAKTEWLLKNKSFLTKETIGFEMPKEKSLDIDTELDLQIARWMAMC